MSAERLFPLQTELRAVLLLFSLGLAPASLHSRACISEWCPQGRDLQSSERRTVLNWTPDSRHYHRKLAIGCWLMQETQQEH